MRESNAYLMRAVCLVVTSPPARYGFTAPNAAVATAPQGGFYEPKHVQDFMHQACLRRPAQPLTPPLKADFELALAVRILATPKRHTPTGGLSHAPFSGVLLSELALAVRIAHRPSRRIFQSRHQGGLPPRPSRLASAQRSSPLRIGFPTYLVGGWRCSAPSSLPIRKSKGYRPKQSALLKSHVLGPP